MGTLSQPDHPDRDRPVRAWHLREPRTPVIIGVGQFLNRVDRGDAPIEPTSLMAEALRAACDDAGGRVALDDVGLVAVVAPISWKYTDPGRMVADRVGARSADTWLSAMGGNSPQMLINRLAGEIAAGAREVGAVVGAEAWWTRSRSLRSGRDPEWSVQQDVHPTWTDPASHEPFFHASEMSRGVVAPAECYPLFESALWHESGLSSAAYISRVGALWSGFSTVAADNPYAWSRESYSPAEIVEAGPGNRMVAHPYTKRMVANPDVDMAAGCLVASAQWAGAHGVPLDRWVFIHAGTDGHDPHLSERLTLTRSPAIEIAGGHALSLAGVSPRDLTHVDLYSCFPSAVEIARRELHLPDDRALTVYGGLPFAGGPWNNPVSHAVATMVDLLREVPGSTGLVTAVGGNLQKHSFGVYASHPPRSGYRYERPQAEIDARGARPTSLTYAGVVEIESCTVIYQRTGDVDRAHASALTPEGTRVWGVVRDPATARSLAGIDLVGAQAHIDATGRLDITS